MNDEELIEKVAKVLQDRDAEMGECAFSWAESQEGTHEYYRKSARLAIPMIRADIVKIDDSRIEGLQRLLAFYRLGKRPTESLFSLLEKSEKDWKALKEGEA